MEFYDWFDRFALFLKGYYAGLPLEKRCRSATDIIKDAIKEYTRTCHEIDWMKEES